MTNLQTNYGPQDTTPQPAVPAPNPGRSTHQAVAARARRRGIMRDLGITNESLAGMSPKAHHALNMLSGWQDGVVNGVLELFGTAAGAPTAAVDPDLTWGPFLADLRDRLDGEPTELWLDDPDAVREIHRLGDTVDSIAGAVFLHPRTVTARRHAGEPDRGDKIYAALYELRSPQAFLAHLVGVGLIIEGAHPTGVIWAADMEQCWAHALEAAAQAEAEQVGDPNTLGLMVWPGQGGVDCVDCPSPDQQPTPLPSPQPAPNADHEPQHLIGGAA